MPFFLIIPIWLFCMLIGFGMICFARSRFLFAYLVFGSTLGLVTSLVLSTAVIAIVPRVFDAVGLHGSGLGGLAFIGGYLGGIGLGGLIGVITGVVLARRFNRKVGWV